jgi:serine/threonine protein phosphatase PrpC
VTRGQLARHRGGARERAIVHDRFQRVTLARCTVGTVPTATTEDRVVLLASDGVYAVLGAERMAAVVHEWIGEGAVAVAEQLLDDALTKGDAGQRDNASVVVIEIGPPIG